MGSLDLALVSTARTINLAGDIIGSPDVPIPAGDYRVEALQIVSINALDTDGTGSAASCAEYLANFPPTGTVTWQDGAELDVIVTIAPNAANVIQLTIDVDEFVKALASAWRCTSFGCPGGEPWCLGPNFLQARFKLFTDQYFSFD